MKYVSKNNMRSLLFSIWGWVCDLRNEILDITGKLKASIIPIGAGLKVVNDKLTLDTENIEIDPENLNIPDASATEKGIVKVDGTTITVAEGVISAVQPKKVSDLTNDSQFQTKTEVESIAAAAASAAKDELIGGAPDTYDTLKEIADYISTHGEEAAGLAAAIGAKADQTTVDNLTTTVNGKANASTSLAGYGITDAKIVDGTITLGEQTITPLTSNDIEAFTDEEIEEIIAEVEAGEAA